MKRLVAPLASLPVLLVGTFLLLQSAPTQEARAQLGDQFLTPLPIPKVLTGLEPLPAKVVCRRGATQLGRGCFLRCPSDYRLRGRQCRSSVRRIRIPIKEQLVQILPGKKTWMWTFGGSFPGPTIRVPSGKPVHVTFANELTKPKSHLGSTDVTVHLHGGHSPEAMDGQPHFYLIRPGKSREYVYPLREDGKPERAAFQWYHDHLNDHTARNVWRGLAGMFVLDDTFDSALPLPKGAYDVPLMLVDRSFDGNNQLTDPFKPDVGEHGVPDSAARGVDGDVVLVNGALRPYFTVEPRKYRLRFLNAANFRSYELAIEPEHLPGTSIALTEIANESGLLPAPRPRPFVVMGPGERSEVVVDFSGLNGSKLHLQGDWCHRADVGKQEQFPERCATVTRRLLQFRVTTPPSTDTTYVPLALRPLPSISTPTEVSKEWVFGLGDKSAWGINGTFDPSRIDHRIRLGEAERWRFVLAGGSDPHIVHIHATDFVVLPDAEHPNVGYRDYEGVLKETFRLGPNQHVVDVVVRFTDHRGRFVLHCHMLEHEDTGMMAQFQVTP